MTATNKGRGEANIRNWGFTMDCTDGQGGLIFGAMFARAYGPQIPCALGGLDSQTWFLDREGLFQSIAEKGGYNVKPFVDLGNGTRILGPAIKLK